MPKSPLPRRKDGFGHLGRYRPRGCPRRRPGRACAGPARAPRRPPGRGDRRRRRGRGRSGASSPPRGASRAGSPCRCRRCRVRSRAPARTGPGPCSPRLAEGSMPSEPVSIAASSLRMSPKRFSVTITSKLVGPETSCMAALSTSRCSSSTPSYSGGEPGHGLAPEPRRLQHVRLVDGGDPPAPLAGGLEGHAGDALDLLDRVGAVVVGAVTVPTGVTEVDAPGELPDHQQVGPLDALAAQRARLEQRLAGSHGPQVGEQAEALAQAQQPLLRSGPVGVRGVPLGTSDRTRGARRRTPGRLRAPRR